MIENSKRLILFGDSAPLRDYKKHRMLTVRPGLESAKHSVFTVDTKLQPIEV